MSEDRDRFPNQTEDAETTDEDVEAHKLAMNDEPDSNDDDVEAHKLA